MNTTELKKLAEAEIERCGPNALGLDSAFALAASPAAISKLLAINAELVEALKEERRIRLLGQQPDIHWESMRDLRRSCYAATDAALAKAEGGEL